MLNYIKAPYLELKNYHAPIGIQSYYMPMKDGINIRLCFWINDSEGKSSRGTILLQQGYNEFIEKYFEVIDEFLKRGFSVISFDWRGQGMSEKTLDNKNKAFIQDFSLHDSDLENIMKDIIEPFFPKPYIGVGHSMGGCLMLSAMYKHPDFFDKAILSAPMLGFKNEILLMPIITILSLFSKNDSYLLISKPNMGKETPFEDNDVTTDKFRYERTQRLVRKAPNLRLWGVTISWARAVKNRLKSMRAKNWAEKIKTKVLIINNLNDQVVDPDKINIMSKRLSESSIIEFNSTKHEIFMEKDIYRHELWKEIDNYLNNT